MKAWEKLLGFYEENQNGIVKGWNCLSKCFDDPSVTPLEKCREENCLIVEEKVNLGIPFRCSVLAAGKYAVTNYPINASSRMEDIGEYIQKFYKEWFISSGYEADHYPLIQRYHLVHGKEVPKRCDDERILDVEVASVDLMIKIK